MKHVQVIVSVAAILFGVSLVGISLVAASQVQSQGNQASRREMYFKSEVLPDHALYPLLMAKDRVLLEIAQPKDRIHLRITYATQRMHYARRLIAKEKYSTALSTATKAQKYLLTAALEARQLGLEESCMEEITSSLRQQTDQLIQIQEYYSDDEQMVLQTLIAESESFLQ